MRSGIHRVIVATAQVVERRTFVTTVVPRQPLLQKQWTCQSCLQRQEASRYEAFRPSSKRHFSLARVRQSSEAAADVKSSGLNHSQPSTAAATSAALPSHTAQQRSAFSKRLAEITDSVLARASIAGQHINTYTGTDYTGIENLRKEIREQEAEVKTRHTAVGHAKTTHDEARAKQASSQKEIVGLLERKSSWSPADLERYMSLVRSEHIHDQAVQRAAEELALGERELEGARSLLEKFERKQYHEEQIWSDTIRRNSTWVTMGLMGVNILLLLAQISIFEPYRRRKIVKQVKEALDERGGSLQLDSAARNVDLAVEPSTGVLAAASNTANPAVEPSIVDTEYLKNPPVLSNTAELDVESSASKFEPAVTTSLPLVHDLKLESLQDYVQYAKSAVVGLFSNRAVQMRQVEVTTIALEGAATGMVFASAIALLMFRASS